MRASLIVAAGGSGSRFQKTLPDKKKSALPSKLFYPLGGRPLIERTLEVFQKIPYIQETVIAAPRGTETLLKNLAKKKGWKSVKVTAGGATRAESVWKALRKTSGKNPLILVHDGARPFITKEAVDKLITAAKSHDAVLLGKKVVPTIKEAGEDGRIRRTMDRNVLFEAETPQLTTRELLEKAYRTVPRALEATDESSLLETLGIPAYIVTHEGWNPKITSFKDFELAEAVLSARVTQTTGFGRDTHRLVEGRKFWLGGITVPFNKGPLGHSDGDALLHAIIDGILGACGRGDIGDWFSDKNKKFKNISSSKMLQAVLEDIRKDNYQVKHVDTVIILEKPKLGTYKQKMKQKIAQLLKISENNISIKAKTAEGLGPEGQGLAVTCEALVTLTKDSI